MYSVKICNMSHLEQAVELTTLKNKHGGLEANWMADYDVIFKKYLGPNPEFLMLGTFDGDKLISTLSLAFFNRSDPAWFIVFMYTSIFGQTFSFNREDIGPMIKAAFEIAEKRHYWQYYYTIAKKHELIYDKLWRKNQYVETGRYDTIIELEVPPYTPLERDRYWRLVGQRVHDVDVVIKKRTLKEELRKESYTLHPIELSSHKDYTSATQLQIDNI